MSDVKVTPYPFQICAILTDMPYAVINTPLYDMFILCQLAEIP